MGKKSKKKRRKMRYNKKDFVNILCKNCAICDPGTDPTFCYDKMYKSNPLVFVNECYKSLLEADSLDTFTVMNSFAEFSREFSATFCNAKICGNIDTVILPMQTHMADVMSGEQCMHFWECIKAFNGQTIYRGDSPFIDANTSKKAKRAQRKKDKKNKKAYICKPYATFFSNDAEYWNKRIRKVLYNIEEETDEDIQKAKDINEDNDSEQDTNTRSTGCTEGNSD